jgi:hypothetical protein
MHSTLAFGPRVERLQKAPLHHCGSELNESLPPTTFKFFADRVGVTITPGNKGTAKSTWGDLCGAFELEMERMIANKTRGASREEGIMSLGTRSRYRQTVRHFTAFLADANTPLSKIEPGTIEKYKVDRHKKIIELKQSRGGSSIALDIAVLHRMFSFALSKQMIAKSPTEEPFTSRKRLYERAKALGVRSGVWRVTPHCFRDTFACDILARGEDIYGVAKMLADTVDTVEKHYAQFVLAARDAAQHRMDNGLGIEERGKLAEQRGRKVINFRQSG